MKSHIFRLLFFVMLGTVLYGFFNRGTLDSEQNYGVSYSDFIEDIRRNAISEVIIDGSSVEGHRTNGERFTTYNPSDSRMIDELLEYGVKIKVIKPQIPTPLMQVLISWAPMLLLIAVSVYFIPL